jgi:hypothetical protein
MMFSVLVFSLPFVAATLLALHVPVVVVVVNIQ